MKRRALKTKDGCSFWTSEKRRKGFSKINYSVKSYFHKWVISHSLMIQFPIENYYIRVKFDNVLRGVNIELRQKMLLQVSVREVHIYMQKKAIGGSIVYNAKVLVHVYDYDIPLLI